MNLKFGGINLAITGDELNTRVDLTLIKDTITILYNEQNKDCIAIEPTLTINASRARRIAELINLAVRLKPVLWGTIKKPMDERVKAIQTFIGNLETEQIPSMDLTEKEGDQVRYFFPDSGYVGDQFHAGQHLKVGNVYTVKHVDVGSSSSTVTLKELPGLFFNTVLFCKA